MSEADLKRRVEAILFSADIPVDVAKLVDILSGASRDEVRDAVRELNEEYERDGRSFGIQQVGGGWQYYCRPEFSKWVRELHKGRTPVRLSQAALETLAIVAYKQPIVRAEIEIIRGVYASGVLATLLKRNLVKIVGRAPGMGRALMYGTTREFLRYFGLNSMTDLPRLEEFAEVLGLDPEELEMTIAGAESLSAMAEDETSGEGDGPDPQPEHAEDEPELQEAVPALTPTDQKEESGAAEAAGEHVPSGTGDETTDQPAEAEASAPGKDSRAGGDVIQRVPVTETPGGLEGHHINDSDLAEALDED